MRRTRPPCRFPWPWLAAVLGAGCSGGGGATPSVQVPALGVVATVPPDGATLVDPRADVLVTFTEPVGSLGDAQFVVADGTGPLLGRIDSNADGRTWRWRPFRDLPRGGTLQFRLPAGVAAASGAQLAADFVGTFGIREATSTQHLLGPAGPGAFEALAWPSGARAVVHGGTLYTLDQAGPVPLPLPSGVDGVAWRADAVGGFVGLLVQGYSGFLLQVLRGDLAGGAVSTTLEAPACLFGRAELACTPSGDVAAYWYGLLPAQAQDGLWTVRAGQAGWNRLPLPPLGSYPMRRIAIAGDGGVFVGNHDVGRGRLSVQRHAPGGAVETYDVAPLPDWFHLAGAGNGDARVVWRESTTVGGQPQRVHWCRHYRPDQGFGAAVEWHRGEAWSEHSFAAGSSGAAVAIRREASSASTERLSLQRLEADGRIGAAEVVHDGPVLAVHTLAIAPRGEAWFLFVAGGAQGRDELVLVRSRPGQPADARRILHTVGDPSQRLRRIAAAFDDSGRGTVVFHEDSLLGQVVAWALAVD